MRPPDSMRPNASSGDAFSALYADLRPLHAALDAVLAEQVSSFEPEVRDLAAYCLSTSGKRLRPMLVFLAGAGAAAEQTALLVRAAAVIEMTHLATLVHDDIMDHALLRRGRPTISSKDGPSIAVLLGDALFAQSVWLSTQFPDQEVCRRVANATRQVCTGEIIQTLGGGQGATPLARYLRIIDLKTAELFEVSCRLGAYLAPHAPGLVEAASRFGRHLGIAYQIYDDLADFASNQGDAGKTLGTDWSSGKMTLPLILLAGDAGAAREAGLAQLFSERRPEAFGDIRARMIAAGVFGRVAAEIEAHLRSAEGALDPWSDSAASHALLVLVRYLRERVARVLEGAV